MLKILLVGGNLVSVGSGQADRYSVNYEDIRVVQQLGSEVLATFAQERF